MSIATHCITLTDDNFQHEVVETNVPVLVDCWASWCSSFHRMNPLIHGLSIDVQQQIKLGKLNIATAERLAKAYSIRAVPTLLFFNNGQVIESVVGGLSQQELAQRLKVLLVGNDLSRSSLAYL